jgi:hypothetical protein
MEPASAAACEDDSFGHNLLLFLNSNSVLSTLYGLLTAAH